MQYTLKLFVRVLFLVSNLVFAQQPLELTFDLVEMELLVNNKLVDQKEVGYDCNLKYSYFKKSYTFNYIHNITKNIITLPFAFIEKKKNITYVKLNSLIADKSIFVVNDNIYKKGTIEFTNTVEENEDLVSFIYRFSK